MKGNGRYEGRTQDQNVDTALTAAGKIFILAVVTILIVVATGVISVVGVYSTRNVAELTRERAELAREQATLAREQAELAVLQSVQNQLHTDCLLALVTHDPPKACDATLRQLEDDGFLGPVGPDGDRNPHNDPTTTVGG